MRRALAMFVCAVVPLGCAAPELGRQWPADHPLVVEDAAEVPLAELPELAPRHELPVQQSTGVGHGHGDAGGEAHGYVCPMHPDVTSDAPGTCPRCGMELVRAQRTSGEFAQVRS